MTLTIAARARVVISRETMRRELHQGLCLEARQTPCQ